MTRIRRIAAGARRRFRKRRRRRFSLAVGDRGDGPRGSFVAVALPGGFIAMYESALHVRKPEPLNTKLWSQPLYVAAMGAVAVFQFYRPARAPSRRRRLRGFGPIPTRCAVRPHDAHVARLSADSSFDPAAFRGNGAGRAMETDDESRVKRAELENAARSLLFFTEALVVILSRRVAPRLSRRASRAFIHRAKRVRLSCWRFPSPAASAAALASFMAMIFSRAAAGLPGGVLDVDGGLSTSHQPQPGARTRSPSRRPAGPAPPPPRTR